MKRFTQTEKWDDPWFWELSPTAKLLWLFLCDHCDNAGVIDLSLKMASTKIGQTVKEQHLAELSSRLKTLECGKVFIRSFIRFQYGNLSRDCKPHVPVFASLTRHGIDLTQIEDENNRVLKPFPRGLDREQEKEKEKDQEKDQEKKEGVQGEIQDLTKSRRPSLEEVRLFCAKSGLPESDADWFFHKCEGNGWTNGGKPIKRWGSTITAWKAAGYMPSQKAQPMLSASGEQAAKPLSLFEMKTILQAKEVKANDLKAKFSSEAALGVSWSNQEKRAEWVALRKEIKELNERIASYAR